MTAIGVSAFEWNDTIESVVIPEGVTDIGSAAFCGCELLESVELPSTLMTMGTSAFSDCPVLTSVDIPYGITAIPNSAFMCCFALVSVNIPESVQTIGICALTECEALETLIIPASVTAIGDFAFGDCPLLTAVYFLGEPPVESSGGFFNSASGGAGPSEGFCVYYPRSFKESWPSGDAWSPAGSSSPYPIAPFGMDVDTMGAQAYSDGSRFRFAFDISVAGLQEELSAGDMLEIGFLVRSRANYDLDGVLNKVTFPNITWTQDMDTAADAAELKEILYASYYDAGMRIFFAEGDSIRFVLAMGNMSAQQQTMIVFGGYAKIGTKEYRSVLKQNSIEGVLASNPSSAVE